MTRALLIAAALLAVPTVASADEPVPEKARQLAVRGRELHDRGDYPRAIAAFKEAYVIAPSPALLFNLAQSYRLQGNCDDATLMYRRFLSTDPTPHNRQIAQAHLDTVERCTQKRSLGIPMDASMSYLQSPASASSTTEPLFRDEPPRAPGSRKKQLGIGLAVGGTVAIASAVYFGLEAARDANAVEEAYARGAKWKEIEAIDARGQRNASYATTLGVTGVLAAAGGVTLYVLGKRDERAATEMRSLAVVPTRGGGQVSLAWSF